MPANDMGTPGELDLVGREAWDWLRERGPLGIHLLDFSLTTLPRTFGRIRRAGAVVPVDPSRRRRWDFFLAIEGRPDRRRDWDRLVWFQELLLEYVDHFAGTAKSRRLADRFHPVLISEPRGGIPLGDAFDQWVRRP